MTAQCINCTRLNLRESALARHGFGRCTAAPAWEFASLTRPRECARFQKESGETIEARRAWLAKQDAKN